MHLPYLTLLALAAFDGLPTYYKPSRDRNSYRNINNKSKRHRIKNKRCKGRKSGR